MSIAQIVTRGYGSFGDIPNVVTRGYLAGAAVTPTPETSTGGGGGRRRRPGEKVIWHDDWIRAQEELTKLKAKPKKEQKAIARKAVKAVKESSADIEPVTDAQEFIFDNAGAVKRLDNIEIVLEAYFMLQLMQRDEEDVAALMMLGVL